MNDIGPQLITDTYGNKHFEVHTRRSCKLTIFSYGLGRVLTSAEIKEDELLKYLLEIIGLMKI